jgi:hypothetical protein
VGDDIEETDTVVEVIFRKRAVRLNLEIPLDPPLRKGEESDATPRL